VFDRRVGLDPVGFDPRGNMVIRGPSELPRWWPGAKKEPWIANDSGSIPVSINRYTWSVSSQRPGRDAMYAFDNNVRTWWEPEDDDPQPSLVLDLGCRNPSDANQEFYIDSVRLLFDNAPRAGPRDLSVAGHRRWYPDAPRAELAPYRYTVESSLDNKTYSPVVNRSENQRTANVEFAEFPPAQPVCEANYHGKTEGRADGCPRVHGVWQTGRSRTCPATATRQEFFHDENALSCGWCTHCYGGLGPARALDGSSGQRVVRAAALAGGRELYARQCHQPARDVAGRELRSAAD
jgi:hypothetical protein